MESPKDASADYNDQQNKVDIQLHLKEYSTVLKERDSLLEEVDHLKKQIADLNENIDFLKEEHAEELAVLSSSFSQHFESKDDNNNEEKIKEYERELQKLKNSVEDKNYHINQLQRKLMKTQVEMETEVENHEAELENLRSQLEKLQNSDTESLIELRMGELKENYEKEISELKAKLEREENGDESTKDEKLSNTMKEVDELKEKLKTLEDTMDERLQEEETKFRREVMSVKEKLIHQHQLEIDELLSQLERSNAEVEKLRRLSRQSDNEDLSRFQHVSNGEVTSFSPNDMNGLENDKYEDQPFELAPVNLDTTEPMILQELESIHSHYQHQFEFLKKRMKERYQQDLDESVQRVEESNDQQLEKQRNDYEDKIVGIQRQLRSQFQTDLERVTIDMEEQIQSLKDGHTEEIAELMMRVRGLSDERRRSYIEQDNTEQHVIVIKEEFKSKVENLEQELRVEKEKVEQYESKLQSVDVQIQAFKAEKEKEVKYIEEELKKQCKALVEKKTKEVKERYQSELNEKVNKVEKALRKQYDEESVRTRSELEESHRTLKEKYDSELSDIMTQMEQVQQRNQEVFEAQQKEQFEKQLSIVKEELEPFKDKCQNLENENKALLEKYNRDLSELKLKMDEVENRYSSNEKIEEESLRTLEDELSLYKTKVKELEEGNQMLVVNYGEQIETLKKKYEESEDGELKTLQEEIVIYTKKVEKLQEKNASLSIDYDKKVNNLTEEIQRINNEKEKLSNTVKCLSEELESYKENKSTVDKKHSDEIENLKQLITSLNKDLDNFRHRCAQFEELNKKLEYDHMEEKENLLNKTKSLDTELEEVRKNFLLLQEEHSAFKESSKHECDEFKKKLRELKMVESTVDNTLQKEKHSKELTDKITLLEDTVHKLEEARKELTLKHSDEKELLTSKLEHQRLLVEARENDLESVNEEKSTLEKNLKNFTEELNASKETFEKYKTEKNSVIEGKNNVINELSEKINVLEEKQSGNHTDTKKIMEENSSLKSESKRLKMFIESLRVENNQLLDEMQASSSKQKKQINDNDAELTTLRAEKSTLSKELDRVKERYELLIIDLKDEIENQKKTLHELEVSNTQYAKEIASLVQEMERRQSKPSIDNDSENPILLEDALRNNKQQVNNVEISKDETTQKLYDEIEELKVQNEEYRTLVQELEDEGDNKFGVLLSQHEKELEVLKEELEEQIARKREQLAQEAATKRQKLKEEYESKLRVIYDELVSERTRSKDHLQQINQLGQKVKLLEGISSKQKKDLERIKEEKAKDLERQAKKKEEDAEKSDDKTKTLEDTLLEIRDRLVRSETALKEKDKELATAIEKVKTLEEQLPANETKQDKESSEHEKSELEKQVEVLTARNDKLQNDLQNMDKAKQVVIQMYDEKMEALAIELDDSSERCDVLRKQFEMTKKLLNRKEKEVEEKQKNVSVLQSDLKSEQSTTQELKEKVNDLEVHLKTERDSKKTGESKEEDVRKLLQKLNVSETELRNEKEITSNLTETVEEQKKEIAKRENKLIEIKDVVTSKDSIIAESKTKMNQVQEELVNEKMKCMELEKELSIFKESDGTTLQKMEQMRKELNEVHEKNTQLLKQNYESLLTEQIEEHRVRADEFEAEVATLKGMVDNLEQLIQLKDEDREIQLKECEEKHHVVLLECKGAFEKEKQELHEKVVIISNENDSHKNKIQELISQIRELSQGQEHQKTFYDNEIQNLKKQIDFENSFQVELQEGFQSELKLATEKMMKEHEAEVERLHQEHRAHVKAYEETSKELESTKKHLENSLTKIKDLEQKLTECKDRYELKIKELTNHSTENPTNESQLTSLRNDNKSLKEELHRLNNIIGEKEMTQRGDIDLVRSELEKRFQEQLEEMNKHHSEELESLMMRLQTLVRKENDSKALIKNHMEEINSVRSEMVQRVSEMNNEKEQQVNATKREIENLYHAKLSDLEEKFNIKSKELKQLQNTLRSMTVENERLQNTNDELYQLRKENADLYRKVRDSSNGGERDQINLLKAEIQSLKREIEGYKQILQRNSSGTGSESSAERLRLSQLMKVMEQLMSERNDLELKLREEIIDLKTRCSPSVSMSTTPPDLSNMSPLSEHPTREGLISMLQEFRLNKNQQEQDIQVHIREIEKMIEDIKIKIKSTECADAKIQEMLAKQLQHLEDERRTLVNRLWNLREKHDLVEEKITRRITALSSSPGEEMKSKLYQNLLEENLRKEKEQLHSKQQQVNDLRRKLSAEKALMDRRVAERQRLKQKLHEKDRQENELSTERYELQKKWRDKLRVKEMELKQERFDMLTKHSNDYNDSVAARIEGLISRSSDDSSSPNTSRHDYSQTTVDVNPEASLNRHHLQSEARKPSQRTGMASNSLTELTHFRPYGADTRSTYKRYQQSGQREFSEGALITNGLDDSSDDDSFVLENNGDEFSVEMENKIESDLDSFTPLSRDRLRGMDKNWERNLEDELRQISVGTLRILPSGKVKVNATVDSPSRPGLARSRSDVGSSHRENIYGKDPYEVSPPLRFKDLKAANEYPRSSTAIPGDDDLWVSRNASLNLSQIPTVLPTILKDVTRERNSRKLEQSNNTMSNSPSRRQTPKDFNRRSNSPSSPRSDSISRVKDQGESHGDHSSLYLLNMDDYIDRHRVLSSDAVASLRDLSPSERYSFC